MDAEYGEAQDLPEREGHPPVPGDDGPGGPTGHDAPAQAGQAPLPVPTRVTSHPLPARTGSEVPLLTLSRRVGALVRAGARNPMVVAWATAAATVATEAGLRLLAERAQARGVPAPVPSVLPVLPAGATVRMTESWTVTRVVEVRPHG